MTTRLHATCVAIGGRGVLITGASGAGKSDLALRLIDRGAVLVSDDQVLLARRGVLLYACAPATIAGKLEVRGLGIVDVPTVADVSLALAVRLGPPERLPEARCCSINGIEVAGIVVAPFEPSAPVKVEWALRAVAA